MCDTCQDCACDNVTLPVAVGPAGPAGADGNDGNDGTDGVVVLHNDTTQGTAGTGSFTAFSNPKIYTAPINTLATNGSKLGVTALFSMTGTPDRGDESSFQVKVGGSSWTALTAPFTMYHDHIDTGDMQIKLQLDLVRTSTTNLLIDCRVIFNLPNNGQIVKGWGFFEATNPVSDMSANTLPIEIEGKTTSSAGITINCDKLEVIHYVK